MSLSRSSAGLSALILAALALVGFSLTQADASEPPLPEADPDSTFAERRSVLAAIEAFYVGDHTGSLAHKRASMHPDGAYRYVDREGVYREHRFEFVEGGADTSYVEELLSIDVYENVALARLRLDSQRREEAEYKLMTLHKSTESWRITTIAWGWGVTP